VYFVVSFTPQSLKDPIRNFFTGELKRAVGKEPELKIGTDKLFRAVPQRGPEQIEAVIGRSEDPRSRLLFREIPKGVKEKPVQKAVVPEVPDGKGVLAVWMDGDKRVAVMTDGMVREGEVWGVFTVEKITPDSVTLSHGGGERVLRLGEVRAKAVTEKEAVIAPKDAKPQLGGAEEQLQKVMEMHKSMDPAKLLQGFPQKILDSFMGNQKKAVETN
jgi:hypothetical protein